MESAKIYIVDHGFTIRLLNQHFSKTDDKQHKSVLYKYGNIKISKNTFIIHFPPLIDRIETTYLNAKSVLEKNRNRISNIPFKESAKL